MSMLARKLRVVDYFALAWGTMVGVGWLVVMDDWLLRGGVLGGVLGFFIGGALLFPIAYVYGQLACAIPDAAGEIAYTARVFPTVVSFATGWMMTLAYFIVCPWEAVAVGKIAAYIFPTLDKVPLYQIGGQPVYLPRLVVGLALTALLTLLNYRGIRLTAIFQNWTAFGTIILVAVFVGFGTIKGSTHNFAPLFTHGAFVSTLLVLQIVPYFMTGFESVSKAAEEASPEFKGREFSGAILMALLIGILFYTIVIAAVGYAAPWRQFTSDKFMTAVVFRFALDCKHRFDRRVAVTVQSIQRKFLRRFTFVVCYGTPRLDRRKCRTSTSHKSNSGYCCSLHRFRHSSVHVFRRRNSCAYHGSRISGVSPRVAGRMCCLLSNARCRLRENHSGHGWNHWSGNDSDENCARCARALQQA
jgi:amino acid transporter